MLQVKYSGYVASFLLSAIVLLEVPAWGDVGTLKTSEFPVTKYAQIELLDSSFMVHRFPLDFLLLYPLELADPYVEVTYTNTAVGLKVPRIRHDVLDSLGYCLLLQQLDIGNYVVSYGKSKLTTSLVHTLDKDSLLLTCHNQSKNSQKEPVTYKELLYYLDAGKQVVAFKNNYSVLAYKKTSAGIFCYDPVLKTDVAVIREGKQGQLVYRSFEGGEIASTTNT